ncbi:hypothetical protein LO772_33535 [Yinghuangia sp. ASG 101]|uniref:hypothetical protein n=1 Tax=Yinghuangia sp. ASG 101 TaxID=2896848 RepID=UPI001E5A1093|nr:hypothetical protein [Yinghuangia sp. ASG 101]UGQ11642.1 hypothetical protein LO772_33535 [Yinghuangia sp. ASG 101]
MLVPFGLVACGVLTPGNPVARSGASPSSDAGTTRVPPPPTARPERRDTAVPEEPVRSPRPLPTASPTGVDPVRANGREPVSVGAAALITLGTWDTTADTGPWDAELRARPLLHPDYVAATGQDNGKGPGAAWWSWAEQGVHTTVTAHVADEAGKPPNTDTRAYHSCVVTVTPVTRDNTVLSSDSLVAYVTLARGSADEEGKTYEIRVAS